MMARTYTTVQGDTWDSVAYFQMGDHNHMGALIEANWPLLDIMVFPAGVELVIPDIPYQVNENLPFWRQ